MDCKLVGEFFGPQYQYNYWYFIYTFLLYAPHHIKQSTGSSKTSGGTHNEILNICNIYRDTEESHKRVLLIDYQVKYFRYEAESC